jgi:hypothetical protein
MNPENDRRDPVAVRSAADILPAAVTWIFRGLSRRTVPPDFA